MSNFGITDEIFFIYINMYSITQPQAGTGIEKTTGFFVSTKIIYRWVSCSMLPHLEWPAHSCLLFVVNLLIKPGKTKYLYSSFILIGWAWAKYIAFILINPNELMRFKIEMLTFQCASLHVAAGHFFWNIFLMTPTVWISWKSAAVHHSTLLLLALLLIRPFSS